ncbi:Cap-specific mRNA (nucleoside-2'-O-)-methyltransferase 2 [Lucilia cuprina]|nr:Cap-specific mRNA (nucleoside-2'-O-)-methyltransferase 2 [Lucilia cuprina]
MESCLLCLEINKDILDTIKANSTQWQDLDMGKVIEKHFWPMNNIQTNSWICLSCWQEVNDFHKFYMRIEEAHMNFGKIKVEDAGVISLTTTVECKEEITIQKTKIKATTEEEVKDNIAFCFLEPEILIDQPQPQDLAEPEILIDPPTPAPDLEANKETAITQPLDELDLDDMPLKQACKRLRLENQITNKDPLEKSKKSKVNNKSKNKKKPTKAKATTETKISEENAADESQVKEEPLDTNDNHDSDSLSDNDNDDASYQPEKDSAETVESKRRKAYSKHRTNRKENDQFIAEHFKQMFCDLCQVPFEDFPAMQKHFTENHKQRGYVVCCKRKFFDRTRLVDHLHCHLNPDHFKCNECGKAMSDRISFDSHMLRVHRASAYEVVKQHCCDVCGKSFTEAYVLRIHKLTHLPEEEKKFPCSDCGKNYGSPYLLNQHRQAVHLKRFVKICYICGKAINSSAEFKIHMNKHEGIPAPVINCDVCGLRLTSERGLKLHKESQHPIGGKQEHHCPICPKISPTLKALKKHINTMHEKGYDHKCSICEKAFKRSEALKEHMATHTENNMNLSQDTRLAPPQGLRNGCGPHTSPTKCFVGNSSATGKSIGIKNNAKPYSNRNNNDNYAVHVEHSRMQQQQQHDHHNSQIQEMFEKCFLYQKYATANNWCLPSAQELFKEYYQLESLQELKIKLNLVKSKLNDYVIEDWSLHTRRQDPAGEIPWRLKTETNAEFVTIAWCKMYECLGRFPELIKGPQVNSLHLCEAPGAFITALNHYMYTNYDKNEVQWKWLATTLNPYYEGNPVNRMIMDDRFLLYTLDNWLFHKDFTGNIIDTDNLQHMQQECAKRLGDVHLITADGSVDCIESPDCQEEKVALLHYAEIITALTILAEGGSFVIKMFTLYEASSVSKLFLLNCAFEKVHVFKPCTSKRGNSEVYVICLNYKKEAKHLSEIIEQMKLKLTPQNALLWPLFAKTSLPLDFLRQHEICCRIFMNHQINAIEQNIYSYEIRPHKMIVKRLQNLRTATCNEFYQRYNIQKLPDELKILYKYQKFIEKSYKNQIYKGSHSEREMFKETSKEEHIFKFRKHLNDLEKMLKEHLHSSEIKYKFEHLEELEESQVKLSLYRGQGVRVLNSSLFANVHLLIMRSKLNDLYIVYI